MEQVMNPTAEQIDALKRFAAQQGRTWKAELNHAWTSGHYPLPTFFNDVASLQQIRNQFGPSWLVKHGAQAVR